MAHTVSNVNVRGRLTQVVVLIVLILACMLISQFAQARTSKTKYKALAETDEPARLANAN